MKETYLLPSEAGRRLYQQVKDLPIIDYHCHLSPREIYEDNPFDNIGEMWLGGDHYKWRLMRAFGIEESYITGGASWHDKFQKYAEAIALAAGNPLYHWTQMELSRYFDIETVLNGDNAEEIWQKANQVIAERRLSPRKLINMSRVDYIATTDDAVDTLEFHRKIREDESFRTTVVPSFRTDNLLLIRRQGYREYIDKLSAISGVPIQNLDSFQSAVCKRMDFFVENGCRFADVGIEYFPGHIGGRDEADIAFRKALEGQPVTDEEFHGFLGYMVVFLASEYRSRHMVMQWHLAVKRNANSDLFRRMGPDCGGDCIGDEIKGEHIIRILDAVNDHGGLPVTVLYTLNPSSVPMLSSIAGSFPRVFCGAAWWFCDHKRGIEEQLQVIAETGHIGAFVGMLTDSRSFLSYARHDYFRRILCNLIGEWIDRGEFADDRYAGKLVRDICGLNICRQIFSPDTIEGIIGGSL